MKKLTALLLALVMTASLITPAIAAAGGDGISSAELMAAPSDETGYDLWLRYNPIGDEAYRTAAQSALGYLVESDEASPVVDSAFAELARGLGGLFGAPVTTENAIAAAGAIVVGTRASARVQGLIDAPTLAALPGEGYLIKTVGTTTVIAGADANGALYGAFKLLELVQCGEGVTGLNMTDAPKIQWRVIDHWDNWRGDIERGYAGGSIYTWNNWTAANLKRVEDYARASASVGINTIVINSVNVNIAQNENYFRPEYMPQVKQVADIFRNYGIRLALSIRFDYPMIAGIGGTSLSTADPLNKDVVAWWEDKIEAIYQDIPDFAGVLVKADSEGQPGPSTYGRTHAEGANMLGRILAPHGGIVMWRTFVYGAVANSLSSERVNQAYAFFKPLDGQFDDNVIIQSKNGPLDFLDREPVAPLFGGMTDTNVGIELQITQEYTGQSTHLCYLVPMWKSYFDFDLKLDAHESLVEDAGTTLSDVVQGTTYGRTNSMVVGVPNIGLDTNWTRLELAQANWYGFGRLAWNPDTTEEEITETWIKMTFSNDEEVVETIRDILNRSWLVYEAYTNPYSMGLPHGGDHFSPNYGGRNNSNLLRVDANGIGNSRNDATTGGTNPNATAQYSSAVRTMLNDLATCPEELMCWFHHVPYDHVMKNGKTLWENICTGIETAVDDVQNMKHEIAGLHEKIDGARMSRIMSNFDAHYEQAQIWGTAFTSFLKSQSGLPLPGIIDMPSSNVKISEYAPAGTNVQGDAIVLADGESVVLDAYTTASGIYQMALTGSSADGGGVKMAISGADAGTITLGVSEQRYSSGAKGVLLTTSFKTITLTAVGGTVTLSLLDIFSTAPISQNKPVTAGYSQGGHGAELAVDGDTATYWGGESAYTTSWVRVDLGAVYTIDFYDIAWYDPGNRAYKYNIWVSDTVDDWSGRANPGSYAKVIDNAGNAVNGFGSHLVGGAHRARYVVIDVVGGSGSAGIYEFSVYGEPDTADSWARVTFGAHGGGGTLTAMLDGGPITSGLSVRKGSDVVFTAVPNAGYRLKGWRLNGEETDNDSDTYTLTDIDADVEVTAEFEMRPSSVGAFVTAGGKVSIEAETALENSAYANAAERSLHAWTRENGVSEGALRCTPDNSSNWTATTAIALREAPELTYWVNFETPGLYTIWVLADAPNNGGDSLHWGLDGVYKGSPSVAFAQGFVWNNVGTFTVINTGLHAFHVWAREDGIAFDKFYLTAGSEVPNGAGPAESARGSADDGGLTPAEPAIPISRGKTATASAVQSPRVASSTVDGDYTSTYWAPGGPTGWLKIDLGAVYDLNVFDIYWYDPTGRVHRYKIWTSAEETDDWGGSANPGSYEMVIDNADNEINGFGLHFIDEPLPARYVVIEITSVIRNGASTNAAIYEVDIYGKEQSIPGPMPATLSIRTPGGGDLNDPIEYILSLEHMERVMNVRVRFELDGNMLVGNELEILQANFEAMAGDSGILRWTPKDDGVWEGEFLLMYLGSPDGLTSEAAMDVAKLIFTAQQYGAATVTLTGLLVTGLDEDGFGVTMDSEIGEAVATAMVAKVYSKYDLNRDGVIDQRDLAMAQRYYMVEAGDENWAAAQVCDFVEDGKITMLDLVDLFVNFT